MGPGRGEDKCNYPRPQERQKMMSITAGQRRIGYEEAIGRTHSRTDIEDRSTKLKWNLSKSEQQRSFHRKKTQRRTWHKLQAKCAEMIIDKIAAQVLDAHRENTTQAQK
jgi:hypothetical protein